MCDLINICELVCVCIPADENIFKSTTKKTENSKWQSESRNMFYEMVYLKISQNSPENTCDEIDF